MSTANHPGPANASFRIPTGRLSAALIALGILLRAREFFANRSLWIDEAMLALNLRDRSFATLMDPLADNQAAPIGYLWIQKGVIGLLGDTDWSLRLFAFLSGIAVLFLYERFARLTLNRTEALVGLALLVFARPLIRHGAQVKQYSSDVAIATWLLFEWARIRGAELVGTRSARLSLMGALAVWLSQPAVFLLAALGAEMLASSLRGRRWRAVGQIGAILSAWLASFATVYFLTLRHLVGHDYFSDHFVAAFAPPPDSAANLAWYPRTGLHVLESVLGIEFLPALALVAAFAGSAILARRQGGASLLAVLVGPMALVVFASALGLYPIEDRLVLFLAPGLATLVGVAIGSCLAPGRMPLRVLAAASLSVILSYPLASSGYKFLFPFTGAVEETKPLLRALRELARPGDVVYVYYVAGPAFRFYRSQFGLDELETRFGSKCRDNPRAYLKDLDALGPRPRAWFLFAHESFAADGTNEREFFLAELARRGALRDELAAPGAWLYLFDLSRSGAGE